MDADSTPRANGWSGKIFAVDICPNMIRDMMSVLIEEKCVQGVAVGGFRTIDVENMIIDWTGRLTSQGNLYIRKSAHSMVSWRIETSTIGSIPRRHDCFGGHYVFQTAENVIILTTLVWNTRTVYIELFEPGANHALVNEILSDSLHTVSLDLEEADPNSAFAKKLQQHGADFISEIQDDRR
ncbi:hypothetical protein IMSHALPRED_007847 [Imshaugia aleurites]|uniref:Uncharacterized protein n=1 Tax=Imshaugia aleurites TaxID=172621 RepID=A0A8H3FRA7_9LECA|nr:hypothetical protein IMSHALPRED_007847 [Imshaugia aleurites]